MTFNNLKLNFPYPASCLKSKKKLISALVVSFLVLTTIALSILQIKRPQVIQKKAAGGPATLLLSPDTGIFERGEVLNVNILLNTGGKPVVGVDVSLSFDVEKLQIQSVLPGNLFSEQIVFFNQVQGNRILLSLGSLTPFNGSGIYGTVSFLVKEVGNAQVNFDESPHCKVAQEDGGDILGQTSSGSYQIIEPATPIPSPTQTPTPIPTTTPTPTLTLTPTLTPTVTPVPPSNTPVPSVTPQPITLNFKIKFQGVDQQRPDKTVKVTLRKGGVSVSNESIVVSPDENGIYTGTVTNFTPDSYDILIKGWAHLQKKFTGVILYEGENELNWSEQELLAGDAQDDNIINIQDFGVLAQEYMQAGESLPTDFNLDNIVNIQDFRFIGENYLKTGDE